MRVTDRSIGLFAPAGRTNILGSTARQREILLGKRLDFKAAILVRFARDLQFVTVRDFDGAMHANKSKHDDGFVTE